MTKLLSTAQFAQINVAINNVCETFLQKSIVYHFKTTSLDRFNKDRADQKTVDKTILGLVVFDKDGTDAMVKDKREGSYDYSMGYCLFNVEDLVAQSLIVDKKFIGKAEQDYISFDNVQYQVKGIDMVAQFPDDYKLVKVHFKKTLKNG